MKRAFLSRDNAAYELLASRVPRPRGGGAAEAALAFVEGLAEIAWHAHPGKYADGKLENVLLQVGETLDACVETLVSAVDWQPPRPCPTDGRRRLLHVATVVAAVGGHTRLLKNWVQNDPHSAHSVALTAQHQPVPSWFASAITEGGGGLIVLPVNAPRLCKAKWLRQMASDFDAVILHHHPFDVVPTVAFAAPDLPPVAVMNHADHVFWLGSGVCDMVINIRPAGQRLSVSRRMVASNEMLPIPLEVGAVTCTRTEGRRILGVADDETIVLTVGWASKYIPNSTHNFYATAKAILEQHRTSRLYMVGVDPKQAQAYESSHPRLHCVGIVEDPSPYYAAADLYLEGFPFGSMTALLQAAREGLPVVLPYGIVSPVLATDDAAVADLPRARDEAEYLQQVASLIRDPDRRAALGRGIQDRVLALHTGLGWRRTLEQIYAKLKEIKHEPQLLPTGAFECTADDRELSKLHATYDDVPYFRFLNLHASELNAGVLARLFYTLPAMRPRRPVYRYYGRWGRVIWARLASVTAQQRSRRTASH